MHGQQKITICKQLVTENRTRTGCTDNPDKTNYIPQYNVSKQTSTSVSKDVIALIIKILKH